MYDIFSYLRGGQAFVLHRIESVDFPTQFLPLPNGDGESHLRRLVLDPPPQVLLHAAHALQVDHCPSTP